MTEGPGFVLVTVTGTGEILLARLSFDGETIKMPEAINGLGELITRVAATNEDSGTTRDLVVDDAKWMDLRSFSVWPSTFLKH